MKVLVLLSLVAFSAALPTLLGRTVLVKEDGTVTLFDSRGIEIDILKSVVNPRNVEVVLRAPNTRTKIIQIGESLRARDMSDRYLVGVSVNQNYNQADVLTDIFRQYEGKLDDVKYYSLLNRIQMLVEAGLINETIYDIIRDWDLEQRVQGISDIVPTQGINTLRQYVGQQVEDVMPLGEHLQYGIQRNWNLDQDLLQHYSPLRHFQTLLGQIQQQRELQQGLWSQQQYLPQQYLSGEYLLDDQMNTNQILNQIYRQQLGQTPLNRYLVNMRLVNGEQVYEVPEEFVNVQLLEQIFIKQEMINQKWTEIVEKRQPITEDVLYQQQLINEHVEKLIEQLVYHQNLITHEVEQYIVKQQVVPQELVYQQRLVYQQIHELIERLTYQQLFINRLAENITEVDTIALQRWIVQQNIINEQIQKLIQQLLFQQTHVREQIQVLIQQGQVIPQELVLYQRITYQYVERFLQVLIKQFVYQQTYFKQLIQLLAQQRHTIPQELVSQYFIIYRHLVQLIQHGDIVPEELIYQQRLIHQQIVLMLQQLKVVPEQLMTQMVPNTQQERLWQNTQQLMTQMVPNTQQERLWQTQNLYQRLPRVY